MAESAGKLGKVLYAGKVKLTRLDEYGNPVGEPMDITAELKAEYYAQQHPQEPDYEAFEHVPTHWQKPQAKPNPYAVYQNPDGTWAGKPSPLHGVEGYAQEPPWHYDYSQGQGIITGAPELMPMLTGAELVQAIKAAKGMFYKKLPTPGMKALQDAQAHVEAQADAIIPGITVSGHNMAGLEGKMPEVPEGTILDEVNPEHPYNELFAWVVTSHHKHCQACTDLIDAAIAHAKVTGSVGSTYEKQEPSQPHSAPVTHGVKVLRQTLAARRVELGLPPVVPEAWEPF